MLTTIFQNYESDQKFDIIMAISSLIHISRSEMPAQIKRMFDFLEPKGLAFVSFLEGKGEGYEDPTSKGKNRFFSRFSQIELKEMLQPYFSIVEIKAIESSKMKNSFLLMVLKPLHAGKS